MALILEPGLLSETIGSLAELVRALDRESHPAGYTDALLRTSIPPEELVSFSQWNSGTTRGSASTARTILN
ncbi:MAG: hypothetical protein IPL81_16265 [Flavobacteriales bacterium]|nr:hypothetical protein [Flavobacteriales bacterium]